MSGSTKQEQSSQSSPWAPQQSYILNGFDKASTVLNGAQGAATPTGFTAQMTPQQLALFSGQVNWANGNNTANNNAATGDALAGAGVNGVNGALYGLAGFNPTDNTDQVIANAGKYADNPYISGQVSAAMRDANQEASDITLPGIQRNAALTGNTNANRRAISEGIVSRGLAQQAGDISAQLRGSAFNTGITTSANEIQNDQAAKLGALTSLGGIGGSAANSGVAARSGSITDQGNIYNIANQGAAAPQANQQLGFDNQNQGYNFNTNSVFQALQNYMNLVGGNYGSESSGTSTTTPSAWSVIGGLMGSTGSLLRGINTK